MEDSENSTISTKELNFEPMNLKQVGNLIYIMTLDSEVISFEWQCQLAVIKTLMQDITNLE